MKQPDIERLIRLAQKTGDTLIIAGNTDQDSVVLMPVQKYEAMMDIVTDSDDMESVAYQEEMEEGGPGFEDAMIPDLPIEEELPPAEVEPAQAESKDDFGEEEERFYLEPVE